MPAPRVYQTSAIVLSRLALHRLTELGFPDAKVLALVRLYDETCLALCEGQFMDIWSAERAERMSVDFYFDMIGRKTAALIAASVQAGAMLATDDQAVIDAYRGFGWSLGIAFQLNDDLLGIWGDEARTGKEPSDLAKHKKTLPVIYALENADPADAARLREILAADEPSDAEVAEARSMSAPAAVSTPGGGRGPSARRRCAGSRAAASSRVRRWPGCACWSRRRSAPEGRPRRPPPFSRRPTRALPSPPAGDG